MELWTKKHDGPCWMEWPSVLQALAALNEDAESDVLLMSLAPDAELAEITAALRLVRRLVPHAASVIVASPHPSNGCQLHLHSLGVDHIWLVDDQLRPDAPGTAPTPVQEIGDRVCPALHAQTRGGRTLSVCGRHEDRLVLAPRHMTEWCLAKHKSCPHWQNSARG